MHTSLMAEAGINLFGIMDRLRHKREAKKASQKFGQLMRSLSDSETLVLKGPFRYFTSWRP